MNSSNFRITELPSCSKVAKDIGKEARILVWLSSLIWMEVPSGQGKMGSWLPPSILGFSSVGDLQFNVYLGGL